MQPEAEGGHQSVKAHVRHTAKAEGIAARAASIEAHGLRQNLSVLPADDPKRSEVVAGAAGSGR